MLRERFQSGRHKSQKGGGLNREGAAGKSPIHLCDGKTLKINKGEEDGATRGMFVSRIISNLRA